MPRYSVIYLPINVKKLCQLWLMFIDRLDVYFKIMFRIARKRFGNTWALINAEVTT